MGKGKDWENDGGWTEESTLDEERTAETKIRVESRVKSKDAGGMVEARLTDKVKARGNEKIERWLPKTENILTWSRRILWFSHVPWLKGLNYGVTKSLFIGIMVSVHFRDMSRFCLFFFLHCFVKPCTYSTLKIFYCSFSPCVWKKRVRVSIFYH